MNDKAVVRQSATAERGGLTPAAASYLGFPELTIVLNSGGDVDLIVESAAALDDVSLSDKSTLFRQSGERARGKQTRLRRRSPRRWHVRWMDGRVDARLLAPATKGRKSICFLHPEAIRAPGRSLVRPLPDP